MCKLAAFPPYYPPDLAFDVIAPFGLVNTDGIGTLHINETGFKAVRTLLPLGRAVSAGVPLFDHMPHPGWTICHLRYATHGSIRIRNTHPFVFSDYGIAHNGVWTESRVVRAALRGVYKFRSQTDSAVAAYLINKLGPVDFVRTVSGAGVYLCLKKDGTLWVAKSSGDLEFVRTDFGFLLATTMSDSLVREQPTKKRQSSKLEDGAHSFDKDGEAKEAYKAYPRLYTGDYVKRAYTSTPYSGGGYDKLPYLHELPSMMSHEDTEVAKSLANSPAADSHLWDEKSYGLGCGLCGTFGRKCDDCMAAEYQKGDSE